MVQVLHAIEVVEIQENNFFGMRWQETTDLLQTFSYLDTNAPELMITSLT